MTLPLTTEPPSCAAKSYGDRSLSDGGRSTKAANSPSSLVLVPLISLTGGVIKDDTILRYVKRVESVLSPRSTAATNSSRFWPIAPSD
jgi:hypothetical protein